MIKKIGFFALFLTLYIQVNAQFYYEIDQDLRKKIIKEQLKELEPYTPQVNKKTVSFLFNSDLIFKEYEKSLVKKNLKTTDIALIYSFFKSNCEKIIQGDAYTTSNVKKEYVEMNSQLSNYFEENDVTNYQLQNKYDRLILIASWLLVIKSGYDSAAYKQLALTFLQDNKLVNHFRTKPVAIAKTNKKINSKNNVHNPFDDIHNVIMRTVTSYGLSGTYIYNQISVLYKNGDLFTNPSEALETFDIILSKSTKPKKWKSWKKNQGKLYVTNNSTGKVSEWKKWFNTRPGKNGHTFNGVFETSDPFSGSKVINASTVYFDNKGRFAWSNLKGGSWNMNSVYVKSKYKGTYNISNYTIDLTYKSGKKEFFFFCRYPVSNEHFIIGNSHFVPKK